jgi:hypothetical protein
MTYSPMVRYERLGYVQFKAKPSGQSYRGNEVQGEVFFRHASKPLDIGAALKKEAEGKIHRVDPTFKS